MKYASLVTTGAALLGGTLLTVALLVLWSARSETVRRPWSGHVRPVAAVRACCQTAATQPSAAVGPTAQPARVRRAAAHGSLLYLLLSPGSPVHQGVTAPKAARCDQRVALPATVTCPGQSFPVSLSDGSGAFLHLLRRVLPRR